MDTARYRAFVAAADSGSFTRAAELLNYSPSGVSQLVTSLENELGFPLLVRSKRGVSVSVAGEKLLTPIRALLQQETSVLQIAAEINGLMTGEVRIASYSSISSHWLPKIIKEFQRDYPQVKIHLLEGIRQEILQWLGDARADIAFLSRVEDSSYDWIPLRDDPMLAMLPKNHPLAGESTYPVSSCNNERFIMDALGKDEDVVELFDRLDLHPEIAFSTFESFATFAMIEQGLGMTITNQLITEGIQMDVVKLPLDPPQHIQFGILVPDRKTLSPAGKKFVQYAQRIIQMEA